MRTAPQAACPERRLPSFTDSKLDWQAFNAPQEAQLEAERLVRPEETHTIDSFEDDCPKCVECIVARKKNLDRRDDRGLPSRPWGNVSVIAEVRVG